MPARLDLSIDELLSTTRAVRRRLDLTRPVEREVIEECLTLATQAPNGQNRERWNFVVVSPSVVHQANAWGSVLPATWSFMLAARSRGLGTVWTTPHLQYEREAAAILSIPYESVMQLALIPVAYTIGTDFRPGPRAPLSGIVHWDTW
jgi:nitroreductase